MTLRRPAVHLRRAPGWRRSGDDSCWERLISKEEDLPCVLSTPRIPRPQSATEGGRLDDWVQELERMQNNSLRTPVPAQVPPFSDRTASMPSLNKEPVETWRQRGTRSFSRGSSPCESLNLCESSVGSHESLQTGLIAPAERRGSWERARIMQAPKKEQTKLSDLDPVKIGWLPIQRGVMMVADDYNQNQLSQSGCQVKLKQPITPTFKKNPATTNKLQVAIKIASWGEYSDEHMSPIQETDKLHRPSDNPCTKLDEDMTFSSELIGQKAELSQALISYLEHNLLRSINVEVERSHSSPSALDVRSWQTPDRGSPIIKQVLEKQSSTAKNGDRPISLQALRRGWNINRFSALPGGSQSNDLPAWTSSNLNEKTPLAKTTYIESYRNIPVHQTTFAEPCRAHIPLQRTIGFQPLRATINSQTTSSATTISPQNKTGFSSITISSRKISRSTSLPGSERPSFNNSTPVRKSPPPPRSLQPMDPTSMQISVPRKATIVKVTQQKMTCRTAPEVKDTQTQPTGNASDTVVHRRKATIIKVTEHREHRHSYTEGASSQNSRWSQAHPSDSALPSHNPLVSESSNPTSPLPKEPEKNGETLHRSMLNLFVSNPPAAATRALPEFFPKPAGQRLDRPARPLSCNANVFRHTEQSVEKASQSSVRKWSFELPQETNVNSVNPENSFISSETAVKEAGQPKAETLKPNGNKKERLPLSEDAVKMGSTSLTLIKAPDPGTNQSPEDVLALNAAAIIANIKLQSQLRKKTTEKDSTASPQGNTEKSTKPHHHQKSIEQQGRPPSVSVPLKPNPEKPTEKFSLQEALQRSRPDFIIRSQDRVRKLERRAQERRVLTVSTEPRTQTDADLKLSKAHRTKSKTLKDKLRKPRFEANTGKETQLTSKRTIEEVKKKTQEAKKRQVCLTNRQRVELFTKKLLDQILQRSND